MELQALLTLNSNQELFANPKRINLLKHVDSSGSISQGAKLAGLSYKGAWSAINAMNAISPEPIIFSEKGGKGGGGAKLTEFGHRLLKVYTVMNEMQHMVLKALLDNSIPTENLLDVMSHFSLKTSARNQLTGTITSIETNELNDLIKTKLASGSIITTVITHSSTEKLQLAVGKKVILLFKAPAVTIAETGKAEGGYNQLKGRLVHLNQGEHRSEVFLDIGSGDILYASIDNQILERFPLTMQHTYVGIFDPHQILITCML